MASDHQELAVPSDSVSETSAPVATSQLLQAHPELAGLSPDEALDFLLAQRVAQQASVASASAVAEQTTPAIAMQQSIQDVIGTQQSYAPLNAPFLTGSPTPYTSVPPFGHHAIQDSHMSNLIGIDSRQMLQAQSLAHTR